MALRTFMMALLTVTLTLADTCGGEWKGDNKQVLVEEVKKQLKEQMAEITERHKRSDDMGPLEVVTSTLTQKVALLEAELTATKAELTATKAQMNTLQNQEGSSYVRWGRSQCPSNANLVYNGMVGSAKYTESGGGSNRLCLTHSPQFDAAAPLAGYHAEIHGVEWYIPAHNAPDVPCAVCSVPQPVTLMIPGTKSCPAGWTLQYSGHITANHVAYTSKSDFLCADDNPEDREGTGPQLSDGGFFMFSTASCGSLPCPPYIEGKVVTCVVCSK